MDNPTIPRVALITRIAGREDLPSLRNLLAVAEEAGIKREDTYVILRIEGDADVSNTDEAGINLIHDNDPTGPVSMNVALREMQKDPQNEPDFFLIASKEVALDRKEITKLTDELLADDSTLVVGYKFRLNDKVLNDELQSYYKDENLIAYRVPWNTCAAWNYTLFKKYVGEFDEITTAQNPFPVVDVAIDGISHQTPHTGMEDGLAIAKAVSANGNIHVRLMNELIPWAINAQGHREKLARKDIVMRDFITFRGYSVDILKNSIR